MTFPKRDGGWESPHEPRTYIKGIGFQQHPNDIRLAVPTLSSLLLTLAMTIKASKFTPEVLLSAPRRSGGIANSHGSQILFSVTQYSFAEHKETAQIKILDVKTNESHVVTGT